MKEERNHSDIRPHRRHRWMVQSYSPGGTNVPSHAHWSHLANNTELMLPLVYMTLQCKWQIAWFSRFSSAHGRVSSGTLAPLGEYDWDGAHWRPLANRIELVLPSAHPSPQPKWQIDQFSRFCTAHGSESLCFTMGNRFPQSCPFSSVPPSNSWFLGRVAAHNPNGIMIGSAVFAQVTAECPCTLQWVAPSLPLKIAPSDGDLDPI